MFNKFCNSKIVITLIIALSLNQMTYAKLVSGSGKNYEKEQNQEWVTSAEFNAWAKEMQEWFDKKADEELLLKVASRSELHGYRSEKFYKNGGVN